MSAKVAIDNVEEEAKEAFAEAGFFSFVEAKYKCKEEDGKAVLTVKRSEGTGQARSADRAP